MTEMTLEPFAAKVRIASTIPLPSGQWSQLLVELLAGIGAGCESTGPCLVGHIKCLASFGEQNFLRASLVNPAAPPEVEGLAPEGVTALDLILNVLVYGLKRDQISAIVEQTLAGPEFLKMEVGVTPLQQSHEHHKSIQIHTHYHAEDS